MSVSTLASGAMGRMLGLPPPVARDVMVRRGLAVRARDGVILRTDHYAPALPSAPTVLVRTPYGRTGVNALLARTIAARGYHVVIQSCRGTGGSGGGTFTPMRHERQDGQDTVEWLRRQAWFTGRLGTFGPSYLGFVQWAIADTPELGAMATIVTASGLRDPTYAGEAFSLDTTLTWAALIQSQDQPWLPNTVELLRGQPRLRQGLHHLPLAEADLVATGAPVEFFREWLASAEPDHGYWDGLGHHHRVPAVTAPVLMVGGWQDIFLPWQLRDYGALRSVGARPYLTVGPWTHGSYGLFGTALRESLAWFGTHLRDEPDRLRDRPVRVYVGPEGGWRDFDEWPPPGARTEEWSLAELDRDADRFRYDPVDPTPSVGGPVLTAKIAGVRDNRELEAREDVLVYSSRVLAGPIEVIGPVRATVRVRTSGPWFDVFVRLCDAWPDGRSLNVCDGLTRVTPERCPADAHGVHTVEVELWPAAHVFAPGHRLRVLVAGGAHPRYARNPGTGRPLGEATELWPVEVAVLPEGSHLTLLRTVRP
jgi:putative CocE/NonD family hydrolase